MSVRSCRQQFLVLIHTGIDDPSGLSRRGSEWSHHLINPWRPCPGPTDLYSWRFCRSFVYCIQPDQDLARQRYRRNGPKTSPDQFSMNGKLKSGVVVSAHMLGVVPKGEIFQLRINGIEGRDCSGGEWCARDSTVGSAGVSRSHRQSPTTSDTKAIPPLI